MKNYIFVFFQLWIILSGELSFAQAGATPFRPPFFVPGQIIVKIKKNYLKKTNKIWSKFYAQDLKVAEVLSPDLGYFLLSFDDKAAPFEKLKTVRSFPEVELAQLNHYVEERSRVTPNDEFLLEQWPLLDDALNADIHAQEAWSYGTGGTNRFGEELVVAVVDSGFDPNHVDLKENIWTNQKEIADNGIDDDENGYLDDLHGWNAYDNNGNIPQGSGHGTAVIGLIGAKGNNRLGVAGVNWQTKLMLIAGANVESQVVVKAYSYMIKQKQLYLESEGKKGANIVVANSSFGHDYVFCQASDYPMWNSFYDALGDMGILSVAATTNYHANVDEMGDVPTTCESDYLITVTGSMNKFDLKMNTGYGKKSIDLAAPGYYVYTTAKYNAYTQAIGTSYASPQVAGAVALMHSVASINFMEMYKENPAKASLLLKEVLLQTVIPTASYKVLTVTEGRLDLARAVAAMAKY